MFQRLRSWIHAVAIDDLIVREHAILFQWFLCWTFGTVLLGMPIVVLTLPPGAPLASYLAGIGAYSLAGLTAASSLVLIRRGRFNSGVTLFAVTILGLLGFVLVMSGIEASGGFIITFVIPVTLAGLLSDRRVLVVLVALSIAIMLIVLLLEQIAPSLVGAIASTSNNKPAVVTTYIIMMLFLGFLLDRFSLSLRKALITSLARQEELSQLSEGLEQQIRERTAALEGALALVQQREARLEQTLNELRQSQEVMRELSAPVIPVLPGVLVTPLTGSIDGERARLLAENVLGAIERMRARHILFDVTGVPVVDTYVGQVLIRTAAAARLLGAQASIVGIRPEVAETVVSLGLNLDEFSTYASLQQALLTIAPRS